MSQAQEINKLPLILTAIVTVVLTVAVLHLYGYLNFVNPEKGLELAEYRVVTVGSEEAGNLRSNPAKHEAECVDGILVLHASHMNGLSGVLRDSRDRVVRCVNQVVPALEE
ncbi:MULTISPECIES: hypothetical protein [Pseudomonas]|jgi:hypothetical protein|uniref:Uncharacterized protein n=2 Tax=Pseudomonas abyssi TaxID=170540 RepID=A0ACD6B4L4_9PSED|nr:MULTISPECIES: hypothetical protein [Pseudomonadaceae]MAC98714.1 hypothetical protein [Pseudomonadales bacterium]MAG68125.1 hypothetical protein [Pseudomonadales bacterium]PBK05993.1 hypothetical protein CNQ84_01045 [Pseudomonas abyssi]RGP54504.1 hypothetical protein ASB58_11550 [Halopseudomonas gallaeciensis]|tara:strand:+ start:25734 stop:26066 length:333 start_codon:yes stop_codon:yes gene_type:complete